MRRNALRLLAVAAIAFALPAAAELRLLSAGAARSALIEATLRFEKLSGVAIAAQYSPVGPIMKQLADGASPDIVVLSQETMAEAAAKAWVHRDTIRELGRVGIGVAVHESAAAPDISTPEALKSALLAARSIVYIDPARGTSGRHFAQVLERLGIAADVHRKARLEPGGYVVESVGRGEIEIGVHQISEILPVKGVKLVGPLPAPLQKITIYEAAIGQRASDPAAAGRFLDLIGSPDMRAVFTAKGFAAD